MVSRRQEHLSAASGRSWAESPRRGAVSVACALRSTVISMREAPTWLLECFSHLGLVVWNGAEEVDGAPLPDPATKIIALRLGKVGRAPVSVGVRQFPPPVLGVASSLVRLGAAW